MNDFNSIPATAADTTDQITNAGEPVTDQAPAKLPTDYMKNGFLNTSPNGKPFLKSEYVGAYAQEIAAALTVAQLRSPPPLLTPLSSGTLKSICAGVRPMKQKQLAPPLWSPRQSS